jgi:serine phosphatase RsbU (regulator of sigma subunit)
MKLFEDGRLEYINCGHLKPLLRTKSGVRALENGNVPVGLLSPMTFTSAAEQLEPGDQLLLFTDGIVEAENTEGEFYGNERLESTVAEQFSLSAVFASVDRYRGSAPLSDDCTAMVLRYGPRQG